MIPLLENEDELKEFLEYCEQAVEETGNTLNERGPLQREHFRKIKNPARKHENTPIMVLLSETAWTDIGLWDYQEQKGISDQIACMKYIRLNYPAIFDTFNGNQPASTTLWSFSGPPSLGYNPSQDIEIRNTASFSSWAQQWKQLNVDISNIGGITKLTITYD